MTRPKYLITRNRRLAILEANHLEGAVIEVRTHGEADEAFGLLALWDAIQKGDVAFLYGSSFELFLEQGMGVLVLSS